MPAFHQIVLAYSVTATNATPAAIQTAMAAVPLYTSPTADPVLGQMMGLTVDADATTIAMNVVTRTLTLNMDPAAGTPFAPPFFTIHPQTVDNPAAIFSTSIEDALLATDTEYCPPDCDPDCAPEVSTRPGIGAYTVEISYHDAGGHAGTVSVTLNGRTPVSIPLAAGTLGIAVVDDIVITSTGLLGANVGQLTVSVVAPHGCPASLTTPAKPCPTCSQNPSAQDLLQDGLGQALGYVPNSYYSYAMQTNPTVPAVCPPSEPCPPCPNPCPPTPIPAPPPPTPNLLIAGLTSFFTNTLSLALAAPVVAATPVLV